MFLYLPCVIIIFYVRLFLRLKFTSNSVGRTVMFLSNILFNIESIVASI